MDFSLIISTLAAAKDLLPALINERDRQKAAAIQINLTEKITDAQIQLSQVLNAIFEKDATVQRLSQRNGELEAAKREKERYALAMLGAVGNFPAYRLRAPGELVERSDEPPHFACQPCFDIRQNRVVLHGGSSGHLFCPVCKVGSSSGSSGFAAFNAPGL